MAYKCTETKTFSITDTGKLRSSTIPGETIQHAQERLLHYKNTYLTQMSGEVVVIALEDFIILNQLLEYHEKSAQLIAHQKNYILAG